MKKQVLKVLRECGGQTVVRWVNRILRKVIFTTHHLQFVLEWGENLPANWFDHNLDLYYLWHKTRNPLPWERGIFGLLAMRQGARVLELCCGDGFYTYYFYSIRAGSIVAIDIDENAIRLASRDFTASNVKYIVADVLAEMPEGKFDNIVWDAALEYFTESEISQVMQIIKSRLADDGVLSGHVIVQKQYKAGQKYAFKSRNDLIGFLKPIFSNIRVFETTYPSRCSLYFYAGQGELPFDINWQMHNSCS